MKEYRWKREAHKITAKWAQPKREKIFSEREGG
jgi:hypothetical protein